MAKQVFNIAEATDRAHAGGKAYALGEMTRAGFTVPEGFVVSAQAHKNMTLALQKQILGHFDSLHANLVAVRSSAINEDGSDAAWAGQLDTFLNCTRGTLLGYIQKCWDSANSARAQAYAQQKALQRTKVAVVVQKMIQSEVSGVAFSVHPVTHNAAQVVIEAGLGLGEAVVSGQVTPDTYVVNKATGQPAQRHISTQDKLLARAADGETEWQDAGPAGNAQKLSDTHIRELCALVAKLETFFTHPVDVEWAIADGKIYILQSRPITTLAHQK